jgi:hypothetical protein
MYPDPMIPLLEKVKAYEEAIKEIKEMLIAGRPHRAYELINELEKKLS